MPHNEIAHILQELSKAKLIIASLDGKVCVEGELHVQEGKITLTTEKGACRLEVIPISKAVCRTPTLPNDLNTDNPTREDIEHATKSFLGRDIIIYGLSREYDKLAKIYVGKNVRMLPVSPKAAKSHKNWKSFQKLADLIEERSYNSKHYLKAQFETMKYINKQRRGWFTPLVSSICSNWGVDNYTRYVQDMLAKGLLKQDDLPKEDLLYDSVKASQSLYNKVKKAYPELSAIQCFNLIADSLSPAFVSIFEEYIIQEHKKK